MTATITATNTISVTCALFTKLDAQQKDYIDEADLKNAAESSGTDTTKTAELFKQLVSDSASESVSASTYIAAADSKPTVRLALIRVLQNFISWADFFIVSPHPLARASVPGEILRLLAKSKWLMAASEHSPNGPRFDPINVEHPHLPYREEL